MDFSLSRRELFAWALAAAAPHAMAQKFPSKPITLLVGFAPGGASDLMARMIAQGLTERLGQPVVVVNKAGGNGVPAARELAHATPDGYTLHFTSTGPYAVNQWIYKSLPYDPAADYTPVSLVSEAIFALVVPANSPHSTLSSFLAYAKANPGKLSCGTPGQAAPVGLAVEPFKKTAGIDFTTVPFQGFGPAMQALVGNHIDFSIVDLTSAGELLKASKVKGLAVALPQRHPNFPDIPTFEEQGRGNLMNSFPSIWFGVVAPPKTPPMIIDQLQAEISQVMSSSAFNAFALRNSVRPLAGGPTELERAIKSDVALWGPLITALGLPKQ